MREREGKTPFLILGAWSAIDISMRFPRCARIYLPTRWPRPNTCWRGSNRRRKREQQGARNDGMTRDEGARRRTKGRRTTPRHCGGSLTPVASLFGDFAIAAGMYTYLTTWPNPATCSTIENDRFPSASDRSTAVTEASNRKTGAERR